MASQEQEQEAVTNSDHAEKLSIINKSRRILPGPSRLHEMVSRTMMEEVAIDFLDAAGSRQQLTYQSMGRCVDRLSAQLRKYVKTNGTVIPVLMPQSPELYVSYLAILKAGAAFCPLQTDIPVERIRFVVRDVHAKLVLTTLAHASRVADTLPGIDCQLVSLVDLLSANVQVLPSDNMAIETGETDTAYVMYTSGSTGLPKGVRISHNAIAQSLLAHDEHIPQFQRFLQFASPTFDVSVFEIFFPFFRGATIVSCERERMLADLAGTINELDADAIELTPTVAATLLRRRDATPRLKVLLTIGEMLNKAVIEEFGGSTSRDSMLYAMYGPTEASVHCTIVPNMSITSSVKNIGIPLSTVTALILSESSSSSEVAVVPFGHVGELAVAGQLADGYLNRPDETKAAFVDVPQYGRIYRTGDRAFITENNTLHILGRMSDGQVKLRGQRIELGEIEEVACKNTVVKHAVAKVIDEKIVLFCVGPSRLSISSIQATCRSWLPQFMRPNEIVLLDGAMPRLPSGKVDRQRLVREFHARPNVGRIEADGPSSEVMQQVTDIIEQELNIKCGLETSLWVNGLDSLKCIRIASALRPFFPQATMTMLMESETIQDVVAKLSMESAPSDIVEYQASPEEQKLWLDCRAAVLDKLKIDATRDLVETVVPCNQIQIAMLAETLANRKLNFNTIYLSCEEQISVTDIRSALGQIADRNQIMRSGFIATSFAEIPFVQVVWKNLSLDHDLEILHPIQIVEVGRENVIAVRIHHAIYDGWSWDLVVADLNRIVSGVQIGERPQFNDFRKFTKSLKAANHVKDTMYWRASMHEIKPQYFPCLCSDNAVTNNRQSCRKLLSLDTQSDLMRSFLQSTRVTLQTVLQAAYLILLNAYCDTSDVICGIVSSGRETPFPGVHQLIGPCLAVYPMRIDFRSVSTVRDLLYYVHRTNLDHLKHNTLTLDEIKRLSGLAAAQTIFDSIFVWQEGPKSDYAGPKMVHTVDTNDALQYCLHFEAGRQDSHLWIKLTYDEGRLPCEHADVFLRQIDGIVTAMVANSRSALSDIWASIEDQALSISNHNFQSFGGVQTLSTTIKMLAQEDPERIALEFVTEADIDNKQCTNIEQLTYRDLYTRSARMARILMTTYGMSDDHLVCIHLDKSVDLYVAILATILSGAGYMCIDPATPDIRMSNILRESQCRLIITSDATRLGKLSNPDTTITTFSELFGQAPAGHVKLPHCPADQSLAYAVFTSGSTGTPKGVLITRKNLISNIDHLATLYTCNPTSDKLLQACSQAFDVSVFEIFWTWHMGMTLCSAKKDTIFRDIEGFVKSMSITHLSLTPSVAALIEPSLVPTVKILVTAGEPMNAKVFNSWKGRNLYQGYGPSETTNICNVKAKVSHQDLINNVGPAFANTSIFICERQQQISQSSDQPVNIANNQPVFNILPMGAVGEIWIGGDQVGRGYIDVGMTARSWVRHPKYGVLYKSGDIGKLLSTHDLIVLGREDDQIKLRGLRIELGEVNFALTNNSNVKDAFTMLIGEAQATRLISFVVSKPQQGRTRFDLSQDVFQTLQDRLAGYMIPSFIIPIDQIPLTRQGKIDQQTLRKIYEALTELEKSQFSHDREIINGDDTELTSEEVDLARVIANITGAQLDSISRHSSFYNLGLDSISAIRFAQTLGQSGFRQTDVSIILKNASISRLLPLIHKQHPSANGIAVKSSEGFDEQLIDTIRSHYNSEGYEVAKVLHCTPLQEAMLSSQADDNNSGYWNHLKWKVKVGIEKIRQAWEEMVKRHELLRTAFFENKDVECPYLQVVFESFDLPWTVDTFIDDHPQHKAKLNMPPYQFHVGMSSDDGTTLLQLTVNHALYDAEAMAVLLKEIELVIHRKQLPEPRQFSAYVDYMDNMDSTETETFWRKLLTNFHPTRLVELGIMSENPSGTKNSLTTQAFSRLSFGDLEVFASRHSISTLTVLQTALARLLMYLNRNLDVCFGNVYNGRSLPIQGVDRIVGPCFNTLPMRAHMTQYGAILDLLRTLYTQSLDSVQYQPSSLRRIQKAVSPDGRMLFNVMLLLQQKKSQLDSSIWIQEEDSGHMDFPFILEIVPGSEEARFLLELHHKGSHDFAQSFLNDFDVLLEQIVKYPQALAVNFTSLGLSLPVMEAQKITRSVDMVSQNGHQHEWTAIEQEIRVILEDLAVIKSKRISPATSIYELGLDSISAVRLATRLRAKGFDLSSADVLEHATIQKIAKHCAGHNKGQYQTENGIATLTDFDTQHRKTIAEQCSIDSDIIECVLPCTPVQSGILSQFVKSKGSLYYNRTRLTLSKGLDIAPFKQCWSEATARTGMLRSGFFSLNVAKHPFAMIIYKPGIHDLVWHHNDLRSKDIATQGARWLRNLHLPAWEIVISQCDNGYVADIWLLHALYDAKSLELILSNITTLYTGGVLYQQPSLKAVVASILASSRETSAAEAFWKESGNNMVHTKFPDLSIYRRTTQKLESIHYSSNMTIERAQLRCSNLGVNFQSVCQAAWAKFLAMYCGQKTVTFGVILSGRTFDDENLNGAIFPNINTVPLGITVTDSHSDLLGAISKQNAGLMRHQFTPLTTIKRWIGIPDSFFDTVFVLQSSSSSTVTQKFWKITEDEASSEYVVSLEVIPTENNYQFQLTFSPDKIPTEQAWIILDEYESILSDLLALCNTHWTAGDPKLLSVMPSKVKMIPTKVTYLHELVENTVATLPNATALEYVSEVHKDVLSRQTWTYEQLNDRGNQIANLLIHNHAQVGQLVAVCFDKCPEACFAILGVLKAGCAYVTIDPDAPQARKEFILQDAECQILLTTKATGKSFKTDKIAKLVIDDESTLSGITMDQPILETKLTGEHPCYCLYTSGTTGAPKGCLISHNSAVQAMLSFSRIFDGRWTSESRWLQFASFHFDVSVLEQYWSWSVGIRVTSAPRDLLFEDLPGMIHKLGITHLDLTPSLAKLLQPETVPRLCNGVFIVGGEQAQQSILDTWGDIGCLYNFYGPSEVTIGCTVHPQVRKATRPTNIGQQWDNVGSFVLTPHSDIPVIRGAVGELCLSGPLVGIGYLKQPDLTSKKFCQLTEYNNARIYRTGDLVRVLHDGSFDFLGRMDDQVKLRGQRLEIGEINHLINRHSDEVRDVSTFVMKHPVLEREQLVSFFTTSTNRKKEQRMPNLLLDKHNKELASAIMKACIDRLSSYMVPTYLIGIEFMPLTANNKSDVQMLRQLYKKAYTYQDEASCTTNDESMVDLPENFDRLIEIVAHFFEMDKSNIKPKSGLFELGLDSISVIGLSRILKRAGFQQASVSTIIRNAKVLNLAKALEGEDETDTKNEIDAARSEIRSFSDKHFSTIADDMCINVEEIEVVTPCTPLQSGMISKVVRNNDTRNVPYFARFLYKLHQDISIYRLQEAWVKITQLLPILRTRFVPTEDGYAQMILKAAKFEATHLLGGINPRDSIQAFHQWVNNSRGFARSLPWHVVFACNDDGTVYMTLCIFHGLYDGIALPLLLKLVKQLYADSHIESLEMQQFHTVLPHGPLLRPAKAKDFWQQNLRQIRTLDLTDRPTQNASVLKIVRKEKYLGLAQVCHRLNVTLPAVFHAAWLFTLFRSYGINPTLGIVLSGRSIPVDGVETVVGPMFNTIPCSVYSLPKMPTIVDLIKACHDFYVSCLPYQHTSLRDIAKWINHDRDRDLFDSLFVFQRSFAQLNTGNEEHDLWIETESDGLPDYALNLEIDHISDDDQFNITVLAKECQKLSQSRLQSLLENLRTTVRQICQGDSFPLPAHFSEDIEDVPKEKTDTEENHWNGADDTLPEWTDIMNAIKSELVRLSGASSDTLKYNSPSIFELGLDSIDALKLASRLKTQGVIISVGKIMQNPTIQGMAQFCERGNSPSLNQTDSRALVDHHHKWRSILTEQGTVVDDNATILPVTPMQEGLLLNFGDYYHVLPYRIRPGIDMEKLARAFIMAANSIPILRSCFVSIEDNSVEDTFVQVIQSVSKLQIEYVELNSEAKIRQVSQVLKKDCLEAGISNQNLRVLFAKARAPIDVALLGLPHAMYDGWSIDLLHEAVRSAYEGQVFHQDIALLASYLKKTRNQSKDRKIEHFWNQTLEGATATHLKFATINALLPAVLVNQASRIPLASILDSCKEAGITLQSFGLACWGLMLAHRLNRRDVCHGLVLSGRTVEGADQLCFPTFNTVIFRSQIQPETSCKEFLKQVHAMSLEVMENQHFPLKKSLQIVRKSASDIFNTLFTFQKSPPTINARLALYEEYILEEQIIHPPYAVNVEMTEKNGSLWWTCAVQVNIADESLVRELLQELDNIIDFMVRSPEAKLVANTGDGSSICGLSWIRLPASESTISQQSTLDNVAQTPRAHWSTAEACVRNVLSQVARVDENQIESSTSIFHLGLDSISAIKISGQLRKRGFKIPVSQLIQAQTVENIVRLVAASESEPVQVSLEPANELLREDVKDAIKSELLVAGILLDEIENILPAAAGQTYMLDAWQASERALFYADFWFQATATTKKTFENSFLLLTEALPVFRTSFVNMKGITLAVVFKPNSTSNEQYPWSLKTKQKEDRVLARLRIHHALYDAVSLHVIVDKLTLLCRDNRTRLELHTNFEPFLQLTCNGQPNAINCRREFWSSYLENTDVRNRKPLTGSFSKERTQRFIANLLPFEIFRSVLRTHGISIQMLFFAAYARVHAILTETKTGIKPSMVVLGIYMANRFLDVNDIDKLVAPTFNILPLKIDVSSSSMVETAKNIQNDIQNIGQAEYCGTSLREIHGWTGLKLDGYMNFLRLPDKGEDNGHKDDNVSDDRVKVEHAEGESLYDAQSAFRDEARDTFTNHATSTSSATHGQEVISPYLFDRKQRDITNAGVQQNERSQSPNTIDVSYIIPAIDIEARIMPDGNLAIGLFAPKDLISAQEADTVIENVKTLLLEFIENNGDVDRGGK